MFKVWLHIEEIDEDGYPIEENHDLPQELWAGDSLEGAMAFNVTW
jgi:biotin operon repressor